MWRFVLAYCFSNNTTSSPSTAASIYDSLGEEKAGAGEVTRKQTLRECARSILSRFNFDVVMDFSRATAGKKKVLIEAAERRRKKSFVRLPAWPSKSLRNYSSTCDISPRRVFPSCVWEMCMFMKNVPSHRSQTSRPRLLRANQRVYIVLVVVEVSLQPATLTTSIDSAYLDNFRYKIGTCAIVPSFSYLHTCRSSPIVRILTLGLLFLPLSPPTLPFFFPVSRYHPRERSSELSCQSVPPRAKYQKKHTRRTLAFLVVYTLYPGLHFSEISHKEGNFFSIMFFSVSFLNPLLNLLRSVVPVNFTQYFFSLDFSYRSNFLFDALFSLFSILFLKY